MEGRYVRMEPLDTQKHGDGLYEISTGKGAKLHMKYTAQDVPNTRQEFQQWLEEIENTRERLQQPLLFVVIDKATGKVCGRISFAQFDTNHGTLEVSHAMFAPFIIKTPAVTEVIYLLARHAFDELGYRRAEMNSHKDNIASRTTAHRLGFTLEGIRRQIYWRKGGNCDMACYSMLDSEWPAVKVAMEGWLHPANFDENGNQKRRLEDFRSGSLDFSATRSKI